MEPEKKGGLRGRTASHGRPNPSSSLRDPDLSGGPESVARNVAHWCRLMQEEYPQLKRRYEEKEAHWLLALLAWSEVKERGRIERRLKTLGASSREERKERWRAWYRGRIQMKISQAAAEGKRRRVERLVEVMRRG